MEYARYRHVICHGLLGLLDDLVAALDVVRRHQQYGRHHAGKHDQDDRDRDYGSALRRLF